MNPLLSHILRRVVRSYTENLALNLTAVGVIAAATALIGAMFVVVGNADGAVEGMIKDAHISAYFADGVPQSQRDALRQTLQANPLVQEVIAVNEAEAAIFLLQSLPDAADALNEIGEGALPASLEITLKDAGDLQAFLPQLPASLFLTIDYGAAWAEQLQGISQMIRLIGWAIGALITAISVFLVGNTMNLIVYARRAELETLKLVGATWAFIATPFLIEGATQGLVGVGLGLLVLWGGFSLLKVQLAVGFPLFVGLTFLTVGQVVVLGLVGLCLGLGGCGISVRRFWRMAP